jgi:uncharacterized protein with PIN domain
VLKSVSPDVRECYDLALEARRHAFETNNSISLDEYLASEARWLKLAESYELTERLADFLNKPAAFPKHPKCPNCHVPMWLVEIQSSCEKVEYLYECKACEDKMSVTDD